MYYSPRDAARTKPRRNCPTASFETWSRQIEASFQRGDITAEKRDFLIKRAAQKFGRKA